MQGLWMSPLELDPEESESVPLDEVDPLDVLAVRQGAVFGPEPAGVGQDVGDVLQVGFAGPVAIDLGRQLVRSWLSFEEAAVEPADRIGHDRALAGRDRSGRRCRPRHRLVNGQANRSPHRQLVAVCSLDQEIAGPVGHGVGCGGAGRHRLRSVVTAEEGERDRSRGDGGQDEGHQGGGRDGRAERHDAAMVRSAARALDGRSARSTARQRQ